MKLAATLVLVLVVAGQRALASPRDDVPARPAQPAAALTAPSTTDTPAAPGTPAATSTTPPPADYADAKNWLCSPGHAPDACAGDLTTTVINADGTTTIEPFAADPKPAIDCFYVYPTVSRDFGPISDLAVEPEAVRAILHQFARFGSKCRLFAPVYRQLTAPALAALLTGHAPPTLANPAIRDAGYNDIKAAWHYYLEHDNHGRGVVLIGHSQGANVLTRLINEEIDGKTAQSLLVSAILMGTSLVVPKNADVGGDFDHVPVCRRATQTGCAIAFASFRATAPPPANSLFGRPRRPQPGMVAACVNPAALGGGPGDLHAYFGTTATLKTGTIDPHDFWAKGLTVTTPFVSVPGLAAAECVSTPDFNYLAITVHAKPDDRRTHDIPGDLLHEGVVRPAWGLHLVDANLAMGNLLDIVGTQAAAWTTRPRKIK